jgi:hypothetical protein
MVGCQPARRRLRYLHSVRVGVPPVPLAGQERRDEVWRLQFILPPDLPKDPAFDLNSYSWIMFGTWEFESRRRSGYLGDVRFFKRELMNALTDDDKDDDEVNDNEEGAEEADDHEDDGFDDGDIAWDPEYHLR